MRTSFTRRYGCVLQIYPYRTKNLVFLEIDSCIWIPWHLQKNLSIKSIFHLSNGINKNGDAHIYLKLLLANKCTRNLAILLREEKQILSEPISWHSFIHPENIKNRHFLIFLKSCRNFLKFLKWYRKKSSVMKWMFNTEYVRQTNILCYFFLFKYFCFAFVL